MDKIILAFYVNVGNLSQEGVEIVMKKFKEDFHNEEFVQYFIPIIEGETRVECVYPKFITSKKQEEEIEKTTSRLNNFLNQNKVQKPLYETNSTLEISQPIIHCTATDSKPETLLKIKDYWNKEAQSNSDSNLKNLLESLGNSNVFFTELPCFLWNAKKNKISTKEEDESFKAYTASVYRGVNIQEFIKEHSKKTIIFYLPGCDFSQKIIRAAVID